MTRQITNVLLGGLSLGSGASTSLNVLGKGAIPTQGVKSVNVAIVVFGGPGGATLNVTGSGTPSVVSVPAMRASTVALTVPVGSDGTVRIQNTGTGSANGSVFGVAWTG
ncbi:hypothetical protein G9H72_11610 [Motilibacter sp. K478]|nr:hypothetical protein [Motilibacter aurantiacus]